MSGPKIPINADFSQIKSGFADLMSLAKKVQAVLDNSSGEPFNAKQAAADLRALNQQVVSLGQAMQKVSKSGVMPDSEIQRMNAGIKEAVKNGQDLGQILKQLHAGVDTSGMSKVVKEQEKLADIQARARRDMEIMSRERMRFTSSTRDLSQVEERLERMRAARTRGVSRVGMSGQSAVEYLSDKGGWRQYSLDPKANDRHRQELAKALGVELTNSSRKESKYQELISRYGGRVATAASGVMTGAMAGGAGGGALGGIVGLLASFVPGGRILAPVLGGAAGAVGGKMDEAVSEGMAISELRRSLGLATSEFALLRDTVRDGTENLELTFQESANLAKQFSQTAGTVRDQWGNLGKDVGGAVGFARGFGGDAGHSVQFFAQMRLLQATSNDKDARRLSIAIADAMARGGTTAKFDAVLSTLSSFTNAFTRGSFASADVSGYADLLSRYTGSGIAGIANSPEGAASILNKIDAAIKSGGRHGDASKAFHLGSLQRWGVTGPDTGFWDDGGLMGTSRSALANMQRFGEGLHGRAREDYLARVAGIRKNIGSNIDQTNFDRLMNFAQDQFGGNGDMFKAYLKSDLGLTDSESSVVTSLRDKSGKFSTRPLMDRLKSAGVNTDTMNDRSILDLAMLSRAGRGELESRAQGLRAMNISESDSKRLSSAMEGGSTEKLRDEVLRLTSIYDKKLDPGEETKKLQTDMANALTKLATELIPATNLIREGILALVRVFAPMSNVLKEAKRQDAISAILSEKDPDKKAELISDYERSQKSRPLWHKISPLMMLKDKASDVLSDYANSDRKSPEEVDEWMREQGLSSGLSEKVEHSAKILPFVSEQKRRRESVSEISGNSLGDKGSALFMPTSPFKLTKEQRRVRDKIIKEARSQGVPESVALELAMRESSLGANIKGPLITDGMHKGDRAHGVFQYMAKSSEGWNRFDEDQNISHGISDLKRRYEKYGSWGAAGAAHLGGDGVIGPDGRVKVRDVKDSLGTSPADYDRLLNQYDDKKMPSRSALGAPGSTTIPIQVSGVFSLEERGVQVGETIYTETNLRRPIPVGVV